MLDIEVAKTILRQSGVRVTSQRLMIIEELVGDTSHPTVEQIYQKVKARYPPVSIATVYQTVSLLAKHNLILELHGGRDAIRCDPETMPHAHAYCRQCGCVEDLTLSFPVEWERSLEHFHPSVIEVSIYGVCATCGDEPAEMEPVEPLVD